MSEAGSGPASGGYDVTKSKQGKEKAARKAAGTRKPFDVEAAKVMYEAGTHKIRDLVAWSGYCYGTVRRRLLDAGVVLDRQGGNRRGRKKPEAVSTPPQEGDAG